MEARRLRAEWKVRLASGAAGLADLLEASATDERLASMRVVDALGALHHALAGIPIPDRDALRRSVGYR
jgi:hypothetical protein